MLLPLLLIDYFFNITFCISFIVNQLSYRSCFTSLGQSLQLNLGRMCLGESKRNALFAFLVSWHAKTFSAY